MRNDTVKQSVSNLHPEDFHSTLHSLLKVAHPVWCIISPNPHMSLQIVKITRGLDYQFKWHRCFRVLHFQEYCTSIYVKPCCELVLHIHLEVWTGIVAFCPIALNFHLYYPLWGNSLKCLDIIEQIIPVTTSQLFHLFTFQRVLHSYHQLLKILLWQTNLFELHPWIIHPIPILPFNNQF